MIYIEKMKENIFLKFSNKIDNFEFIEKISDYGYLVSKEEKKKVINSKGNVEIKTKRVYNIILKSRMLSCEEWFDTYLFNESGVCIYAIEKSASEYEDTIKSCSYFSINEENIKSKIIYKYGAINKFGENTVEPIYDGLSFSTEDTLIAVHEQNLGFVDTLTGKQITPITFSHLSHFREGLAEVEYNGENRYINKDGVFITKETARLLKKNN